MFKMIKKFWRELNKVRCLEISYYTDDEPIVPDCRKEKANCEAVKLMIDLNAQRLKLRDNEIKSKKILSNYIKGVFERQGLLITDKQLNFEVEKSWQNLKNSLLVNGFNEFQPAIKEVL